MHRLMPAVIAAALLSSTACTVQDTEIPGLAGPSGFALSLSLTATPDVINQDGVSQSSIVVIAHGPDGRPLSGISVRLDLLDSVSQAHIDWGILSARTIVTNSEGRASAVYTAPLGALITCSPYQVVSVAAIPIGSNYEAATYSTAEIRLNARGAVLPTNCGPTASFTFSPSAPGVGSEVFFDASSSDPGAGASAIVSYEWSFGDGNEGSGSEPRIDHVYTLAGEYTVTLTVTNNVGQSAQTTESITVGEGTPPTADFVFSPTTPAVGQAVQFNGTLSDAAPGRGIVSWSWNFGDGQSATGSLASHTYNAPGTYNVVLRVTDTTGEDATVSKAVIVGSGNPIAAFTMSPQPPVATTTNIVFNASASTAGPGATIVSYAWNFGDGTQSGASASPIANKGPASTAGAYPAPGTYSVTLTVTDNLGRTGTVSESVRVE